MNLDPIDPALMDDAAGHADPAVAALIQALAEKDPAVRARLAEWRSLAALAREALHDAPPITLPPFAQISRTRRLWRPAAIWGAGMAACLAVGIAIGSWAALPKPAPRMAQLSHETVAPPAPLAPATPDHIAAVTDFWSVARLRALAENARTSTQTPVPWPALFHPPIRFGG